MKNHPEKIKYNRKLDTAMRIEQQILLGKTDAEISILTKNPIKRIHGIRNAMARAAFEASALNFTTSK
jgi:hypothetical protein